jgi:hypothetical protein
LAPGDPGAAGAALEGDLREVVCGRAEPPAGGALSVSRMEPVAGRFDGRGGARLGAGAAASPAGGGSVPERGSKVTRGTAGGEAGGVAGGCGVEGTSSGIGGREGGYGWLPSAPVVPEAALETGMSMLAARW